MTKCLCISRRRISESTNDAVTIVRAPFDLLLKTHAQLLRRHKNQALHVVSAAPKFPKTHTQQGPRHSKCHQIGYGKTGGRKGTGTKRLEKNPRRKADFDDDQKIRERRIEPAGSIHSEIAGKREPNREGEGGESWLNQRRVADWQHGKETRRSDSQVKAGEAGVCQIDADVEHR